VRCDHHGTFRGEALALAKRPPDLEFRVVGEPLSSLAEATILKLEREWPHAYEQVGGAQLVFRLQTQLAFTTYRSIIYLSAERPADFARKVSFASSAPPLSRSILDTIYSIVFLLEDLPSRVAWYYSSGWREMWEMYERHRGRYAGRQEWADWLQDVERHLGEFAVDWGINDEQRRNPKRIARWPIPTKMRTHTELREHTRKYFQHLEDWFYREFSQEAHVTLPGLARRAGTFLFPRQDEEAERQWDKKRSDWVGYAIVLLLALLSEVIAGFKFDLAPRCTYLWGVMSGYSPISRELREIRYDRLLGIA
jgi:hypothetical protein